MLNQRLLLVYIRISASEIVKFLFLSYILEIRALHCIAWLHHVYLSSTNFDLAKH